jgi:hypothetical protein
MRTHGVSFLVFSMLFAASPARSQSGPSFARDHVYGPGGRVVMTAEPDTTPPPAPAGITSSEDAVNCQVNVSWNAVADYGSGTASYKVYRGSTFLGTTTSTSYTDTTFTVPPYLVYYYIYAVDNTGNVGTAGSHGQSLIKCQGFSPIKPLLAANSAPGISPRQFGSPLRPGRSDLVAYLRWLVSRGRLTLLRPTTVTAGGGK